MREQVSYYPPIAGPDDDVDILRGVAGWQKGMELHGKPLQGRPAEPWMAAMVTMSANSAPVTEKKELSQADRRFMTALQKAWERLKGKYKVPIEHAIEEIKTALLEGATQVDVLAGYPTTGAPLLDLNKANTLLSDVRDAIQGNAVLSQRLVCGNFFRKDKYQRMTITILPSVPVQTEAEVNTGIDTV